jgi:hypothetical protein
MMTLPEYVWFPVGEEDPENLQFIPLAKASLEELRRAVQYAQAEYNKAAVTLEEERARWVVLNATLKTLEPIMANKPIMTVAEAVALAGGSVSEGR